MNKVNTRIAIVVSHPIQHFCPQYVSFSKMEGITVKVFFASMMGYRKFLDKNFGQEIAWNNLRMDEFDHVFLNGEQILPSSNNLDAPTLNDELDRFDPDAIISYGLTQKLQQRAHKWGNEKKVPIAFINDSENRQHRPFLKLIAKYFYLNWYYKKIDFFFTVGNANEEYYKLYGVSSKRFIRMHYPIDITTYSPIFNDKVAFRDKIKNKYNIATNEFVISVAGKLVEWKNQDHLIELLSKLEQKNIKCHLFILGSGTMLDSWKVKAEKLKENKVYFTGFIDPLDLPKYFAASDLYIHPAMIEPHSLAISEAIYMGCPVILSNRCGSYGPDDDVQEGRNGYVYKFGDIAELTELTIKIMNDDQLRKKQSDYSHEIAVKFQQRAHELCIRDLVKRISIVNN